MANLKIGDNPIPFSLPAVDGKTYSLSTVSSGKKATAVIFMCNHCPYVLAWTNRLVAVAKDYAPRGVAFLGISSNDAVKYPADSFEMMKEFSREHGLPFPYLYDEPQTIARAYGAERTPEIFLFDDKGELRYHGAPDDNYDETQTQVRYFRDALEAVLNGRQVPQPETQPVGCTMKWK